MSDQPVVLASVQRVRDYALWRSMNAAETRRIVDSGVVQRWSYQSLSDPSLVFAGMLVRTGAQALAILRNRGMADWLAQAGVDEVPPFFVGSLVASLDFTQGDRADGEFIVAAIHSVPDFDRWVAMISAERPRLAAGGTRHIWLFRALDDPLEVMGMMSLRSAEAALSLVADGTERKSWADASGLPVHPPLFVGHRTDLIAYEMETPPGASSGS